MKQSKKKPKYKKTLNALKLFTERLFEFRLRKTNSDAILLTTNFKTKPTNIGKSLRSKSSHILDGKKKRINKMTKPANVKNK